MNQLKVVFFGPQKSGKTELIKCFKQFFSLRKQEFNPEYALTRGMTRTILSHENGSVAIYEIGGTPLLGKEFHSINYRNASIGVYCIDSSVPIDHPHLKNAIEQFKAVNPKASLYLVGTKADIPWQHDEPQENFNLIEETIFSQRIITSAKEQSNVHELLSLLFTAKLQIALHELYAAVRNMPYVNEVIKKEGENLIAKLSDNELNIEDKKKYIQQFTNNCTDHLEKFAKIMKILLVVTQIATVIVVVLSGIILSSPLALPPAAVFSGVSLMTGNFFHRKNEKAHKVLEQINLDPNQKSNLNTE